MHALKRTSSLPPYSEPAPKNASTAGGALPSGIKTELHDLSEHPEGVATAPKSGSQNDSLTERLLEQLVQTNTKQTKILDRVSKISEDLLTLSHEKLKLERRQLALSSKTYNAQMAAMASVQDTKGNYAVPLVEVPNVKGLFPSQAQLPPIISVHAMLSLDIPTLKDFLKFYDVETPVCFTNKSSDRERQLYRFALSKALGCYGLFGMNATELGGFD